MTVFGLKSVMHADILVIAKKKESEVIMMSAVRKDIVTEYCMTTSVCIFFADI